MFVGRESELKALRRLFSHDRFQMAVVYGRRRVGKTALLDEFAKGKPALFFTAQQKSDALNLRAFSQEAYAHFGMPASTGPFESWRAALSFVANESKRRGARMLFVFDEFPYAAEAAPSLPSVVQIAIDHDFKDAPVCMVLCGSNEGFMESKVLGRKSPLYGRRNAQIKLQPFDYRDAALMLPGKDPVEAIEYYATFGGTPYYLEQIDGEEPYEESVIRLLFDISGILYTEPLLLLKQELREPALYASVLDAVASGAGVQNEIASRAGIDPNAVGSYVKTLKDLGIVERVVPFGENPERSRKGRYRIRDPFFAYWYRFVSPRVGAIESGAGEAAARRTAFGEALSEHVGRQFEKVCLQWLVRENREGRLPFLASSFGSWWGTDSQRREQSDIDVIAADDVSKEALFGESKWRNSFDETETVKELVRRSHLLKGYKPKGYILFSKHAAANATREKEFGEGPVTFVSATDLFA